MSKKKLVFWGVQPTGNLHLGNYLGALKNQFEEFRNDQSIKDKKFSDYITEEFKNDQSKDWYRYRHWW